MTDQDRLVVPDTARLIEGTELPENLPYRIYPTFSSRAFGTHSPALLLDPMFHAELTDEKGSYNPIPIMLSTEGFLHVDVGIPQDHTPAQLRTAMDRGWKVTMSAGHVEIARPGKTLARLPCIGELTWLTATTPTTLIVLVSETTVNPDPRDGGEIITAAVNVSGTFALLPLEIR
ncbi:hypothetical protein [Kitasatospora sp. NPDC088779]|uniref:hypothetical protein n=1 Tax=unclassified Kitasatospora TaxID=2633591 RepID=UPI003438189B